MSQRMLAAPAGDRHRPCRFAAARNLSSSSGL